MNIQQLRYFDEICRCGSLSKAAQNLYISQQGLSMSLLRLEEEFSCKLLNRSSRGVTLTEDGKFFWERAKAILREADACTEYFESVKPVQKSLKIGSAFGVLSEFAANLIWDFQRLNPDVKLQAMEYPDFLCDQAVESGEVEVAFGIAPFDNKKFETTPLFSKRLCLVMRDDHPLAGEKTIDVDSLRNLPLVTVNSKFKSSQLFIQLCNDMGIEPDIEISVGEVIAVHRLVSTSNRIAGLSTETVARSLPIPHVISVPFDSPDFSWDVHLIKVRGQPLMPTALAFSQYIRRRITMEQPPAKSVCALPYSRIQPDKKAM